MLKVSCKATLRQTLVPDKDETLREFELLAEVVTRNQLDCEE